MKKAFFLSCLMVLSARSVAWATWSVIAIDKNTGDVIVASATCVAQAGFPRRQPVGSRDLMDLQAVIVPGIGVAACQAGADNTHKNQMTVFEELKKGTDPSKKSVPIVTLNTVQPDAPDPWFATFSIIAFDPATNELGVAVQSHAFTAGAAVPYAIPGIGAVATQASANRLYGPKAIELLKQGLSPSEVVKRLADEDPGRDTRQVAVIDTKGRSAVYTGKHVIDRNADANDPVHLGGYAGHVTGRNFSVQGNTLASEDVVKNMARAYEGGKGTMAERLMDALDAGQSAGGDTRGMQSAGLLVVRPIPAGSNSTVERTVDIRVDDAVDPFTELRRLLNITLGVPRTLTDRAAELAKAGKFDAAIAEQKKALEIQPNSDTLHYALAQRYAQAGQPLMALVPLREAIRLHPNLAREAARDPLFASLRDLGEFKRLVQSSAANDKRHD